MLKPKSIFCAGLSKDLQTKLHGQHLAQSVVLKAIQGFINNPESNKPLTLSFHGWSGTGKNFVARIIADNLYRDGVKSECVRLFIAPFHFPHARLVDTYKVSCAEPSWHGVWRSVPGSLRTRSRRPACFSQMFNLCFVIRRMITIICSNQTVLTYLAFWNTVFVQLGPAHLVPSKHSFVVTASHYKLILTQY